MRVLSIVVSLAVGMARVCLGHEGEVVLAERGSACDFRLVLPEDPRAVEKYASEELSRYLEAIVGCRFSSTGQHQFVLERDDVTFGEEGFHVVVKNGGVRIRGGRRGLLYGTYEFLERFCGIRWLTPDCTVVPQKMDVRLPAEFAVESRPAFRHRQLFWRTIADDADFAAHRRVNGNFAKLTERHGGTSGFKCVKGLECHTYEKLVPVARYGKTHPEYFAMRNGKRIVSGKPQESMQLCLSNPEVLKIAIETVLSGFQTDPDATFVSISQNDNTAYCQCDDCRLINEAEASPGGTNIRFVNAIAEAVERHFQGKSVQTLAYQYTRMPPKLTSLRKNVMPQLCSIECDFAHPIISGRSAENKKFLQDLVGWGKQSDNLYVIDYATDFMHFPSIFPNFDSMQANLRLFRDRGAKAIMEMGNYLSVGSEFEDLRVWLLSHWMWDPDVEEGPLLDDFFNGYYRRAAPYVRKYFDELRAASGRNGTNVVTFIASPLDASIVSDEFLSHARVVWNEAEAAVRDSDAIAWTNVLRGAFSVDYVRFCRQIERVKARDGMKEQSVVAAIERKECIEAAKRMCRLMDWDRRLRLSERDKNNDRFKSEIRNASGFSLQRSH